jgi:hypothetical protein
MNAPSTKLLIKDYFLSAPADRPAQCESVASHIVTVDDVVLVLDWGATKTEDYYDSATDLLGQCNEIIIQAITSQYIANLLEQNVIAYENKLEILITGISLADRIPALKRLEAIAQLKSISRRLIKTAIIDALDYLKDELELNILTDHLATFLTDTESDEYIRRYAKNALEAWTSTITPEKHKAINQGFAVACRKQRQISLEELVEKITPDNQHEETDWGKAVGQEIWWSDEDDVILI